MGATWKDVGAIVAKSAPMLGGLLGGPAGAAVGTVGAMIASAFGVGSTPDEVLQTITTNPDAAVKLREIEARRQVELEALSLSAATQAIQAVNATMQSEAASDHWPTYAWRPFCGFIFGTTFFGVYFVLPLLKLPVPSIPFEAWTALGAVLGVASWFRGKMQADPNTKTDNRG